MSTKNIFIDCGYHFGEGLSTFVTKLGIDSTWDIYAFEANPHCDITNDSKKFSNLNITPFNKAVWIEDGTAIFNIQPNAGQGSFIKDIDSSHTYTESRLVETVNFAKFVNQFEDKTIYCKMDIEGAEFPVLRSLLETGAISKIKELWVEWHDVDLDYESPETVKTLTENIQRYTKFNPWH